MVGTGDLREEEGNLILPKIAGKVGVEYGIAKGVGVNVKVNVEVGAGVSAINVFVGSWVSEGVEVRIVEVVRLHAPDTIARIMSMKHKVCSPNLDFMAQSTSWVALLGPPTID